VSSPVSAVFTLLFVQKRKPLPLLPIFCLFSLFYAASPGLVGINLLIYLKSRPAVYLHLPLLFLPLALFKKESLCHRCPFSVNLSLYSVASPGLVDVNLLLCLKPRPAVYLHLSLLFSTFALFKKESLGHRCPLSVYFSLFSIASPGSVDITLRRSLFYTFLSFFKVASLQN
jgi:hypothetical protein